MTPTEIAVYALTALGVVDVWLTRRRMTSDNPAGRIDVGRWQVHVHTASGLLAITGWLVYLLVDLDDSTRSIVGIVALAFWWVATIAGLMILSRWLPSHGRHAVEAREDSWSKGPWLSVLAHGGMLAGVIFFTWVYMFDKV